jgi:hypothetical protein
MSNFRTIVPLPGYDFRIGYQNQVLSMGSCFAEHIGQRLGERHFPSLLNPFGILYNPLSIGQGLERLLRDAPFGPEEQFEHQGLWHTFWHHGAFSGPEQEKALEDINRAYRAAQAFLAHADRLIITLGTAFVFVVRASGTIAANCHKLPSAAFDRRRLSIAEIVAALEPVLLELKSRQPALEVLLTVSPVRHIRDGFVENQRSKAALLLAAAELCSQHRFVHYFPAYEIMMDELRGYRFYASDMLHPSDEAVNYIWQRLAQACFDEPTRQLAQRIEKIRAASLHRPFHPQTPAHQQFLRQQLQQIEALEREFPFLKFAEERGRLALDRMG